jgi:hypothetical protein
MVTRDVTALVDDPRTRSGGDGTDAVGTGADTTTWHAQTSDILSFIDKSRPVHRRPKNELPNVNDKYYPFSPSVGLTSKWYCKFIIRLLLSVAVTWQWCGLFSCSNGVIRRTYTKRLGLAQGASFTSTLNCIRSNRSLNDTLSMVTRERQYVLARRNSLCVSHGNSGRQDDGRTS